MNNSILDSIKKLLGIEPDYKVFDTDIIIHINTVLANLVQMGVGPSNGYAITDHTNTWNEFLGDTDLINQVKTYVYLKVKLLFDPPASSTILQSYQESAKEFEWRAYIQKGNY